MIYGPDGRALCQPLPEDHEGILYSDLDPTLITLAKAIADPVAHYACERRARSSALTSAAASLTML
jgi:hypothetical protein